MCRVKIGFVQSENWICAESLGIFSLRHVYLHLHQGLGSPKPKGSQTTAGARRKSAQEEVQDQGYKTVHFPEKSLEAKLSTLDPYVIYQNLHMGRGFQMVQAIVYHVETNSSAVKLERQCSTAILLTFSDYVVEYNFHIPSKRGFLILLMSPP